MAASPAGVGLPGLGDDRDRGGAGTTAEWSGISLSDGATTAAAVVALLILAALGAWIASRVLAATGFVLLLAWGLVGVAVATPQTLVAAAALFAAFTDRRRSPCGPVDRNVRGGTPRVGARSIGPPFARSG